MSAIEGQVINQRDGVPVHGADVHLTGEEQDEHTSSDEKGNFSFPDLEPGTYDLEVNKDGFQTGDYGPLAVVAEAPTKLVLALQPDDIADTTASTK